jgi:DNA-binding CsgD family transcriptional regulator
MTRPIAKPLLDANTVLRLWQAGKDTVAIAERLMLPEYAVANALSRIRDAGR